MTLRCSSVRGVAAAVAASLLAALLTVLVPAGAASAATAADFDPGNIISDAVFFDSSTMTASQVQSFLTSKGASCVAGEQPCLKDFRTVTTAQPAEAGLCAGYPGGLTQSAAEIIVGAARSCGINPRVLVVLLEKESSLVSRTRPTTRSYTAATGFRCPDTAPCNPIYAGFFNQVFHAARQFQNYAANPALFNHRPGRVSTVFWHPNAACGTSQVRMANQATAGLYNYTPYRPNAAALANLYGAGDACSTYGNRNFWRIFTDWFGSTQASSFLLRTAANATVYLVSGDRKYPIDNLDVLVALSPLGRVGIVSDQFLGHKTTGPVVRRSLLGPDGTIYYFDAGIRLPFTSCAQVADYGMSCATPVAVDAGLVANLHPGPSMTNLFRTTSGKAFWVTDGTRREVSDTAALVAAGLPTGSVTLLESGIGYLPLAAPVTRDGQVLRSRTTATTVLSAGGRYTPLPGGLDATPGIASLPSAALDEASLARLPLATALHPVIKDSTTARVYLLTTTGKVHLTDPTPVPATPPTTTSAVLARIPDAGTASTPVFVKSPTNATVNYLHAGQRRPIGSWTDLVGLNNGGPTPVIHTLPGTATTLLTPGPTQVAPGTLIKSPDNGTVYLTHGTGSRITVTSFTTTTELGATRLVTLPTADVNRYTLTPGTLTTAIACGPARYLALSGRLHPLTPTTATAYAITTYTTLDPTTCTALPRTTQPLGRFLATPDGTIYHVTHGTKHPISSWTTYLTLGGTPTTTTPITHQTAARFPTGATL